MAEVSLRGIRKVYDKNVVAVQDFNLEIADREFVVLVGPSGCGKSTTLRMIAGLEEITGGELLISGKRMNDVAPRDRDISMVFQNYALYPHMTVYENIGFSLRMRKLPRREIDAKVRQAAEILDITDLLRRKPKALSGGQRQRVAIGRAIVREPQAFLMDEPLSNLDAKLRNQMRTELIKLRKRINTTFVYVTHDQTEAMTLGDRIVVMKDGVIRQVGTPQEVFDHPADIFVAGFIGMPQMNFLDAELTKDDGTYEVTAAGVRLSLPEGLSAALSGRAAQPGPVVLGVRPEHLRLSDEGFPAKVDVLERMGSTVNIHVDIGGKDVVAVVPAGMDGCWAASTAEVRLLPDSRRIHLFDSETGVSFAGERAQTAVPAVQAELFGRRTDKINENKTTAAFVTAAAFVFPLFVPMKAPAKRRAFVSFGGTLHFLLLADYDWKRPDRTMSSKFES